MDLHAVSEDDTESLFGIQEVLYPWVGHLFKQVAHIILGDAEPFRLLRLVRGDSFFLL